MNYQFFIPSISNRDLESCNMLKVEVPLSKWSSLFADTFNKPLLCPDCFQDDPSVPAINFKMVSLVIAPHNAG